MILLILASGFIAEKEIKIYITPNGKDTHSGSKAEPLKSIEKARDVVRILRKESPGSTVVVNVAGGVYPLGKPVVFSSEDSGSEKSPCYL